MNAEDLKKRTKQFALRVLKLVAARPNTFEGRLIGGQLARAGHPLAQTTERLVVADLRAEFIAKLGIVEEEADESSYWMELIIEASLLKRRSVEPLLNEANEIAKIMAQSRITASGSQRQNANGQSAIGNRK